MQQIKNQDEVISQIGSTRHLGNQDDVIKKKEVGETWELKMTLFSKFKSCNRLKIKMTLFHKLEVRETLKTQITLFR